MNKEPKGDDFEQLVFDIDHQILGGVAVRPSIEDVKAELESMIEVGLRRQQNERLQGSLL